MNPQRIVAAVAALAIGFGVTLVGVGFADDEAGTDSLEQDDRIAGLPEELDEANDDRENPEAEPPETVEDVSESDDLGESGAGEASLPSTTTVAPSTAPDATTTTVDDECADVESRKTLLVVEQLEGGEGVVVLSAGDFKASGSDFVVFGSLSVPSAKWSARTFEGIEVSSEAGFIDCSSGGSTVVERNPDVLRETLRGSADDEEATAALGTTVVFPCSAAAESRLFLVLSEDDEASAEDDVDRFEIVVARSLDNATSNQSDSGQSTLDLIDPLVNQFFDYSADGCPGLIEDVFAEVFENGGVTGFLCAAGQLSASRRLFDYLLEEVPTKMARCTYSENGQY